MPTQQDLLRRQTQASYQLLVGRVRTQLDAFVTAHWNGLEAWRDADIVRFENVILPAVLAGQRQVAQLTNAQLTLSRNIALGTNESPRSLDLEAVTGEAIRGVDPTVVYQRPQKTLNFALSKGATLTSAVGQGLARLRNITATDLQMSKTRTVAYQGQASYFRRTLTGAENCALCVVASTQRYKRGNLQPIHGGCDCGCEEIYGEDPGQILDRVTLEQVHDAITEQFGNTDRAARYIDGLNERSDYLDLIVVRDNSELGPTLAWRDHRFTGAAELPSEY